MKRIRMSLLTIAVAVGGTISPLTAAQAQPGTGLYYETYYYDDPGQQYVVGHYKEWCDGHSVFLGRPGPYDYNIYYQC